MIYYRNGKRIIERETLSPSLPNQLRHFLICTIMIHIIGCASAIQYQPEQLYKDFELSQVQQKFKEVLIRSVNPQVIEVEITEKDFYYRYRQAMYNTIGIQVGTNTTENRVFFETVDRVEIFTNNAVFVRGRSENILAQMVFGNLNDAKTFADLLSSIQTWPERQKSVSSPRKKRR